MPVLCDTQIRELVGIEPFAEPARRSGTISYGLSSYGYDVRVGTTVQGVHQHHLGWSRRGRSQVLLTGSLR